MKIYWMAEVDWFMGPRHYGSDDWLAIRNDTLKWNVMEMPGYTRVGRLAVLGSRQIEPQYSNRETIRVLLPTWVKP